MISRRLSPSVVRVLSAGPTLSGNILINADPAVTNGVRFLYSSGFFFDSRVATATNGISFRTDTSTGQSERLRIEATGWVYVPANTGTLPSAHNGMALGWNKSGGDGESSIVYNTSAGSNPRLQVASFDGTTYKEQASIKDGTFTLSDAMNFVLGSTTGTQLGTATNQKWAAHGATPVI
jgi:hypothetical protein